MGTGITFELNWDCIATRHMENNTVALDILRSIYIRHISMKLLFNFFTIAILSMNRSSK